MLAFALSVSARELLPSFDSFVQEFGRSYKIGSREYETRAALYKERLNEAEQWNARSGRRWTAGVSELWDYTADEFSALRGWRGGMNKLQTATHSAAVHRTGFLGKNSSNTTLQPLPQEKHWFNLQSMQNVRQQEGCGSCWAMAAATVMEAHAELHASHTRTFSTQEIISCVSNPQECGGTGGCGGATMELAMDWVFHHGCPEEAAVPYRGAEGACQTNMASGVAQGGEAFGMHGWYNLPENTQAPLMRAIVEKGPVGVSVAASSWNLYARGVFDWCSKDAILDHAVALVGYGVNSDTQDDYHPARVSDGYWTIQNSWGTHWGEGGTMRLLRFDDEKKWCGIDNKPELGTGCRGGPSTVPVCGMCGMLYNQVVPNFR